MRSQRERIAPLALILLFSFLALPFILYFVPNAWWRGDFDYEPPRRIVEWVSGGEESGAGPTEGMTVGPDGFGTVTEARRFSRERRQRAPRMVSVPKIPSRRMSRASSARFPANAF